MHCMNLIIMNKINLFNHNHFNLFAFAYYVEEEANFKPKLHAFLLLYRFVSEKYLSSLEPPFSVFLALNLGESM